MAEPTGGKMTKAPKQGMDDSDLTVSSAKTSAVGIPAIYHALKMATEQMGVRRTARTLLKLNQVNGFDCMGCAWPDPEHRHSAEFCENGAKAVAEEATKRTVGPSFFVQHSLAELAAADDYWLGQQGRLTQPMRLDRGAGDTHYRPITWDDAFDLIVEELRGLASPDEAIFYTSGRTSNEAAFLYQLMVRGFGTNNLPDCSNMCHESSGVALTKTIGIGKGSVTLTDVESAELIIVAGQNPGTNHPRMLSALEKAKLAGAVIVSVNPLPEAGLVRFRNPQTVRGLVGGGTALADDYLPIRLGGDLALFAGVAKHLLEADERAQAAELEPVLDHDFINLHTNGFAAYAEHLRSLAWDDLTEASGLTVPQIRGLAERLAASRATVVCWAMGLTQHKHAVAMITEIVNVLLLQGNIGRPGAGVCPVRGHSNVQGDRTMGIFEKMPDAFHDALDERFGFTSPRKPGHDTVDAIRAMRDGTARVFVGMGGNFVRATPDSAVTEAALASCSLTVQVSTKLNRSHTCVGRRALILPAMGRTDRDVQEGGEQRVTVEDSMSMVHASSGKLPPPSAQVMSEVAIVCRLADRLFTGTDGHPVPNAPLADWRMFAGSYPTIRTQIAAVVPGFENFEDRIEHPGGFQLPHPPRDRREFPTPSGKAEFVVSELWWPKVPPGRLLLQTIRSHDQFNTTIYGRDDRYRGVRDGRRVVFCNADDLRELGFLDGEAVNLVSEWVDADRVAENFRIIGYQIARGCAAAYFPETNVLVPLDSTADRSNTPTSKSITIRLEHR